MRILYIDIDSLRPDHLGCYGYHRNTSPHIDRLAEAGIRFENCYVSDAPCVPSRTALFSGRAGIHTGLMGHGGTAGDPFPDGELRDFETVLHETSWTRCQRRAGLHTATISSFAERHSAWWFYANFHEMHNSGLGGMERADQVGSVALDWLARNGRRDDWFLHVNFWDPHTPYRTPASFPNPFLKDPLPSWLTEEVRRSHWEGCGPHSAREVQGFVNRAFHDPKKYPDMPVQIDSMDEVRRMFDGYDRGVRYADEHIGRLLARLEELGVLEETAVLLSADHGENLGELNVYGDHQTADQITTRVPLILRWPGIPGGRVDRALHYHLDFAATVVELLGQEVPRNWDGESFASALRERKEEGRPYLVLSQGAWSCQRAVRFEEVLMIRSYHDGYHGFPDLLLFDLEEDPHEQRDLAAERPGQLNRGLALLDEWYGRMMKTAVHGQDPFWTVLKEGGPYHTRGELPGYLERLRETGRGRWAELLEKRYPEFL